MFAARGWVLFGSQALAKHPLPLFGICKVLGCNSGGYGVTLELDNTRVLPINLSIQKLTGKKCPWCYHHRFSSDNGYRPETGGYRIICADLE